MVSDVSNRYFIRITGLRSSRSEVCDTLLHDHTAPVLLVVCLSVVSAGGASEPHWSRGPAPDPPSSLPGRSGGHWAPRCNHPLPAAPGPRTEGQEPGAGEWRSSCIPRSRCKGLRFIRTGRSTQPLIGGSHRLRCYSESSGFLLHWSWQLSR